MLRYKIIYSIFFIVFSSTATYFLIYNKPPNIVHITPPPPLLNVILIPLDSRPPCTKFVTDLGKLGNINIIVPPFNIMDNYNTPADIQSLHQWAEIVCKTADAAIISSDILIFGSLLASRINDNASESINNTIKFLKNLHLQNPKLKIYVFSIIPRLLIAEASENIKYQKLLLDYSILMDKIYKFGKPDDISKFASLENQLPPEVIQKYLNIYDQNTKINWLLLNLAEQGVLKGLILAQDDSQVFGLPNLIKQHFSYYINKNKLSNKIFITRGADEVALTILGHISTELSRKSPKIYIKYSALEIPQIIMPYMPNTIAQTIKEKIDIVGGSIVDNPNFADFILYIHVGTAKTTINTMNKSADDIKKLLIEGYKIALVDLSERFYYSDLLFPILLQKNTPIINLAAYASWNTASNSIGMAITEASILVQQTKNKHSINDILYCNMMNTEILIAHIIDDVYYQKEIFPFIKDSFDIKQLDSTLLEKNYETTNNFIAALVRSRGNSLFQKNLSKYPLQIMYKNQKYNFRLEKLDTTIKLPWTRIFEILINTKLNFVKIS